MHGLQHRQVLVQAAATCKTTRMTHEQKHTRWQPSPRWLNHTAESMKQPRGRGSRDVAAQDSFRVGKRRMDGPTRTFAIIVEVLQLELRHRTYSGHHTRSALLVACSFGSTQPPCSVHLQERRSAKGGQQHVPRCRGRGGHVRSNIHTSCIPTAGVRWQVVCKVQL